MALTETRTIRIRQLKDAFCATLRHGKLMLTSGVSELLLHVRRAATFKVRTFSDFAPDNDPLSEHDFGSFEVGNETFFWKIDYYDDKLEYGSEDPSDPLKTSRPHSHHHARRGILMRYIVIDGKRYAWRDLLRLRGEQWKAFLQSQPALFELKDNQRPASQRTASSRFEEPKLFE